MNFRLLTSFARTISTLATIVCVAVSGCSGPHPPEIETTTDLLSKNNEWYKLKEGSRTAIVFLHGIFSNSESCWKNPESDVYWPNLLANDKAFADCSIYTAGYSTNFKSREFGISDAAVQVRTHLIDRTKLGGKSPLDFDEIIFIGHSTGGIVARELLIGQQGDYNGKKVGVVLVASPALGSSYATWLKGLAQYYKNKMAEQLATKNPYLLDLDKRFRDLMEEQVSRKRAFCIVGTELIESKFINDNLPYVAAPVVTRESMGQYFNAGKLVPDTDHFSIAAPTNQGAESHVYLRSWFTNTFQNADCSFAQNRELDAIFENVEKIIEAIASRTNIGPVTFTGMPEQRPLEPDLFEKLDNGPFVEIEKAILRLKDVKLTLADQELVGLAEKFILIRNGEASKEKLAEFIATAVKIGDRGLRQLKLSSSVLLLAGMRLEKLNLIEDAVEAYRKAAKYAPMDVTIAIKQFWALSALVQTLIASDDHEAKLRQQALEAELREVYFRVIQRSSKDTQFPFSPNWISTGMPLADESDLALPEWWGVFPGHAPGKLRVERAKGNNDDIAMRVYTKDSSYAFFRPTYIKYDSSPILRWDWKVEKLPPTGDCRYEDTDDQSAQLIVILQKAKTLLTVPMPSEIILLQYGWDSNAPSGSIVSRRVPRRLPLYEMRYFVLRSGAGEVDEWKSEERDVVEDLQRIAKEIKATTFTGAEPSDDVIISGIAVQSNTQWTHSDGQAVFSNIRFDHRETRVTQ